ncbi:hypothetical protein VUR80DRAFT_3486 [Thermomyces stellatus]
MLAGDCGQELVPKQATRRSQAVTWALGTYCPCNSCILPRFWHAEVPVWWGIVSSVTNFLASSVPFTRKRDLRREFHDTIFARASNTADAYPVFYHLSSIYS